jgi:flavin reductase (DIM6/NTAB) family NADH-FMN oxidoreductase RutF
VRNAHYLLHPYNASLVTCCDAGGQATIITIAWLMPVSVHPSSEGTSFRPSWHSNCLIRATGEFVINVAPYDFARQALHCGRQSGRDVTRFAITGLTARAARFVRPPAIEECLAHLEYRVVQVHTAGDHQLIVGRLWRHVHNPVFSPMRDCVIRVMHSHCSIWAGIASPQPSLKRSSHNRRNDTPDQVGSLDAIGWLITRPIGPLRREEAVIEWILDQSIDAGG